MVNVLSQVSGDFFHVTVRNLCIKNYKERTRQEILSGFLKLQKLKTLKNVNFDNVVSFGNNFHIKATDSSEQLIF